MMLKAGMWVMDINDIRGHLQPHEPGRLSNIHGAKILCFEIDAVGLNDITRYGSRYPLWEPLWATTP